MGYKPNLEPYKDEFSGSVGRTKPRGIIPNKRSVYCPLLVLEADRSHGSLRRYLTGHWRCERKLPGSAFERTATGELSGCSIAEDLQASPKVWQLTTLGPLLYKDRPTITLSRHSSEMPQNQILRAGTKRVEKQGADCSSRTLSVVENITNLLPIKPTNVQG